MKPGEIAFLILIGGPLAVIVWAFTICAVMRMWQWARTPAYLLSDEPEHYDDTR